MTTAVKVRRTTLPAATIDKPERKVIQIEYRSGEMPPHFVYMDESEYTPEKEKELIKADLEKRIEVKEETLEI